MDRRKEALELIRTKIDKMLDSPQDEERKNKKKRADQEKINCQDIDKKFSNIKTTS